MFIQPLELKTWLMQVFAGNPDIFLVIALLVIISLAAMFRMNMAGMFLMVGIFLLMFSAFVSPILSILIFVIGSLLIGYWLYKVFAR